MSIGISIDARGIQALQRMTAAMERRMSNLKPVLDKEAKLWGLRIKGSFATGRSPEGTAWAALAPSTLKERVRGGFGTKPLVKTGKLLRSIRVEGTPNSLEFKAGAPYGVFHELGTRHHPARPFMPFKDGRVRQGPSTRQMRETANNIRHYILTGKVR